VTKSLGNGVAAVTEDDMDPRRVQSVGGIQNVAEQRLAREGLEDLGQGRSHSGALARRKNDDFKPHGFNGSGLTGRLL
jgi:hypothetical protein